MAINDFFKTSANDLVDGGELIIDGSEAETGAVEVHEMFGAGPATIYKEVDPAGDGSWPISVQIEILEASFHSQNNQIELSEQSNVRLRLVNTDSGPNDYGVNGMEVDS